MQPDLILIPFGKNATPGTIDTIPKTRGPGDDPQQATWDEGFPQVTMTPLGAGGIPPKGQDFNGVLNAISEHTVFTERGGQFKWAADYVAESGGYSIGDVIQADDGLNSYVSLVNTNTANFNTTPGSIGTSWGLYAGRNTQAQATETVSGIAEIATQAEVAAGADDARIITPAKLRGAYASQAEAEAGTDNTKLMTPIRVKQATVSTDGISGSAKKLRMLTTGLNGLVTVTADEFCVKNASGQQKVLSPVSVVLNVANSGANGVDTGSITGLAWWTVHIAWGQGQPVIGLLSLNATTPLLPAGYTHWAKARTIRTTSTAGNFPFSMLSAGKRTWYRVASGSNVTSLPLMANGIAGVASNPPTWVSVPLSGFVPPSATAIGLYAANTTTTAGTVIAAPNNSYGGTGSGAPPPVVLSNVGSSPNTVFCEFGIESTLIYWASGAANQSLLCYYFDED